MKTKSTINAKWHKQHPMPKNPKMDERIAWHLQHLKHCQCRTDLPASVKIELEKRGIAIPA